MLRRAAAAVRSSATRPGGLEPGDGGSTYRPHLDGLRAVAVYLVVAFHAGADPVAGGFVGVDVFFVLSGYLVTGVLVRDVASHGRIRFARFYARRMRRLLPAAAVNLVATAVIFRAISPPAAYQEAVESTRWAALWLSNWWFIRESADYFGTEIAGSPVAHYWSLSVEEQFYALWPVLVALVLLLARRTRLPGVRVLGVVAVVAGAASLAAALALAGDDPNRAYFGTDTRAYQLLAGAALALAPGALRRVRARSGDGPALPAVSALALATLLVVASGWVDVGPITRGALATACTLVLLVGLEGAERSPVARLLSLPVVTYLGRISYATYLWHWIVTLVLLDRFDLAPAPLFGAVAVVATAIAAVSYVVLERPIRQARLPAPAARPVVAAGIVVSLCVAFLVVPVVLRTPGSEVEVASGAGTQTVDWRAARRDVPDFNGCEVSGSVLCPVAEGSGPRVLVVGDSHAGMLLPALEGVAERHDLELAGVFIYYCPWVQGLRFPVFTPDCFAQQAAMFDEVVPAFDADVVVLVHRTIDDPINSTEVIDREHGLLPMSPEREPIVAERTRAVVDALRRAGSEVVIVEPVPVGADGYSGPDCLSEAADVDDCAFRAGASPTHQETVFRALADGDPGVWSVDLDDAVCPALPRCDAVVDGMVVRHDGSHLTETFAASLVDELDAALAEPLGHVP